MTRNSCKRLVNPLVGQDYAFQTWNLGTGKTRLALLLSAFPLMLSARELFSTPANNSLSREPLPFVSLSACDIVHANRLSFFDFV